MMLMTMTKQEMLNMDKSKIANGMIASLDNEIFMFNGEKWLKVEYVSEEHRQNELRRKKINRLNASNYIASDGRIGAGNNLMISEKNYKKYSIKKFIPQLYNMNIILEDVDDIYIFRKNDIEQPGLIMIKNKEKYELVDIGFYPYKQFIKIEI